MVNGTGKHTKKNVSKKMKNSVMEMRVYKGVTGDRVYVIIVTVHKPNYPNDIQDGLVRNVENCNFSRALYWLQLSQTII